MLSRCQDRSDKQRTLLEEVLGDGDAGDRGAEMAERLLDLENRLAEAEEEKGSLQMRLVETEEGVVGKGAGREQTAGEGDAREEIQQLQKCE